MRIYLHIGLEHVGAARIQDVLAEKREQLASKGILFPRALGPKNHTRLYMAVTDPDHIDPLRFNRGYMMPEKQAALYDEIAANQPGWAKIRARLTDGPFVDMQKLYMGEGRAA